MRRRLIGRYDLKSLKTKSCHFQYFVYYLYPECEDPPETATYGTVCELRNDECTPSCPEGMVLPKGEDTLVDFT